MEDSRGLSDTYDESRWRFLDAAHEAGATVESHPHPSVGMGGEELAVDVATLGRADAAGVLLVVSGTHGVEGFTGSALQHHLLDRHAAERPDDVRVVLLHAFNPYGFTWVRRVNEDNVDLNRNFVDWSQPPPANEDYGGIADLLVPGTWDDDTQQTTTLALLAYAEEHGFERLPAVVSGGQYSHPTGVFFGGTGPVWSHRWLVEHLRSIVGAATRVGIVDLHTGLGPWGHGELISHVGRDHPNYERGTDWSRSRVPRSSSARSTRCRSSRRCAPTPCCTRRVIRSARVPTPCAPRCEPRSPTTPRPGSTRSPSVSTT